MTLNITAISPWGIHQSADFRLADFKLAPDGKYIALPISSPKIITLLYESWAGYLTYCGIGAWAFKPTYQFATDWILSLGSKVAFDEVVAVIESSGSTWINEIQNAIGAFYGHSFVLAGFEDSVPRLAFISNTHSIKGNIQRSKNAGLIASVGSDSGVHVYVTGLDSAVSSESRLLLKRKVEKKLAATVIRTQLAHMNATAARRNEAKGGISESCLCYSIDSHGNGSGGIYGIAKGPFIPVSIMHGIDISEATKQFAASGAQVLQTSFATGSSSDAIASKRIHCQLNNDALEGLAGVDIGDMNSLHMTIFSANADGSIVGQLRRPITSPVSAFLWQKESSAIELTSLGGTVSQSTDINNSNLVVGGATILNGSWRAVAWRDNLIFELGVATGNNSMAVAVNDSGVIVGHVFQSPSSDNYHRAFRGDARGRIKLLDEVSDHWSRAVDINNRGQILGWSMKNGKTRCFLWSPENGISYIEPINGSTFYGSSINDRGQVVGEADDDRGIRRPMIWEENRGLSLLKIERDFHPTAIDNEGNVIGNETSKPWSRAWLLTPRGQILALQAGTDHNVEARCIGGRAIFGHASTDEWTHVHPVRWDF
jgi:hypothetical protein